MSAVHVIVPEWIDDPARPSGGNLYGRRVCDGLAALGWTVREHLVDPAALARTVEQIPDGAVVLVDGLLASPAPSAPPRARSASRSATIRASTSVVVLTPARSASSSRLR